MKPRVPFRRTFLRCLLLPALAQTAFAQTIHYVAITSTNPVPPYTTWATAATNIQDAIDVSVSNDTVLVSNGVYATGGRVVYGAMTNRVAITNAIIVQSVNGPGATFIRGSGPNGNAAVRCVYVGSNSALSGFTLTNGATRTAGDSNRERSGGGAWCEVTAVLSNNIIAGNSASYFGGGAFKGILYDCTVSRNIVLIGSGSAGGGGAYGSTLYDCHVDGNSVSFLGGLGGGTSASTLYNCLVTANSAIGTLCNGGGASGSTLYNCAVIGNSVAGTGGGGGGTSGCALYNCTVLANSVTGSSPLGAGGVANCTNFNSIIFHNTTNNHSGGFLNNCCTTPMPTSGAGNFTNAPMTWGTNNAHLRPDSPCIDAGDNSFCFTAADMDGDPRTNGVAVDVGCDEFDASNALAVAIGVSPSTNGQVGVPVQFLAQVVGNPLGISWQFDDGTAVTNQSDAPRTYAAGGIYTVVVTITNLSGSVAATTTVQILPFSLHWISTNSTSWDYATPNWSVFGVGPGALTFTNGMKVIFDDLVPNVQTNIIITTNMVAPGGIVVDAASNNYRLSGAIDGTGGLVKTGSGILTVDGTNIFTGATIISNGTVRLGNAGQISVIALGDPTAPFAIAGGTLDINTVDTAKRQVNKVVVSLSGAGAGGQGAIVNDGLFDSFDSQGTNGVGLYGVNINLASNATIGGRKRWDMNNCNVQLSGYDLSKVGTDIVYAISSRMSNGTIVVSQGVFGIAFATTMTNGSIAVCPGASLWTYRVGQVKSFAVPISIDDGTITEQPYDFHGTDTTLLGPLTISNSVRIGRHELAGTFIYSGPISGSGRLIKEGIGSVSIDGDNSYTGETIISNGTLRIASAFALRSTPVVSIATGATLDVRPISFNIGTSQTIRGVGTIDGPVYGSGVLEPGINGTGMLTVAGYYTPSSQHMYSVGINSRTDYSSMLASWPSSVKGTLKVVLLTSYQPTSGTTFVVMRSSSVSGTYAATNLPRLAPGLGWKVAYLPTNVTLSVTGAVLTGYNLWAYAITNGLAGYTDCTMGDGYPNLLKYATGSSPTNSDGLAAMAGGVSNGVFALRFNRNTNASDVTLVVEGSDAATNDAPWNGIATNFVGAWGGATNVIESGTSTPVSVAVQDPAPPATNRFLRLRVTRP